MAGGLFVVLDGEGTLRSVLEPLFSAAALRDALRVEPDFAAINALRRTTPISAVFLRGSATPAGGIQPALPGAQGRGGDARRR